MVAGIPLPLRDRAERFLRTSAPHHRKREWYQLIELMLAELSLRPEGATTAAYDLLHECLREMLRWRSCQSIGVCRNCADDGVILRLRTCLNHMTDAAFKAIPEG